MTDMVFFFHSNKLSPYNFNFKEEFKIYKYIGYPKGRFRNYTEWHDYISNKYTTNIYSKTTLNNFLHYLIQQRNFVETENDVISNSQLPLISALISMIVTLIFSLLTIINTCNMSIANIWAGDKEAYGYSDDLFSDILAQTLYSDMNLYFFCALLIICLGLIVFSIISIKINNNKNKYYFYCDYIEIIQKLLEV